MNSEQRVAFINAQVACMLVDLAGMQAENAVRADQGLAPAYDEAAFTALRERYALGHNDVITFLGEP
jgi:hypothetical protein